MTFKGFLSGNTLIVISFFFCVSCSNDLQSSYFPLKQGYRWQYDVSLTTRDGLEKQKYILNNLGNTKLHGEDVYLKHSLDGSLLYYVVKEEQIYFIGLDAQNSPGENFISTQQVVMPLSLEPGQSWETVTVTRLLKKTGPPQKTEFKIIARVPSEVTVESLSDTVIVPAGVFTNCLKIKMNGSMMKDAGNYVGLTLLDVEETSWYAPGVGLVKLVREETTQSDALDKGNLLLELASFEAG